MRRLAFHTFIATLILGLAAGLIGCASVGLPTPTTLNERIAAAQGTTTQLRASAAQMLTAKAITVADAENVLKQTDTAAEGIAVVRTLAVTDPAGASSRLTLTVQVLTALQAYLTSKQQR